MPVEFSKCRNLCFEFLRCFVVVEQNRLVEKLSMRTFYLGLIVGIHQQIRDSNVDSDFCVCSNILLTPPICLGPSDIPALCWTAPPLESLILNKECFKLPAAVMWSRGLNFLDVHLDLCQSIWPQPNHFQPLLCTLCTLNFVSWNYCWTWGQTIII